MFLCSTGSSQKANTHTRSTISPARCPSLSSSVLTNKSQVPSWIKMVAPSGSLEVIPIILLNPQLLSSLSSSTILIIQAIKIIFPMITSLITLMIRGVSQVDNVLQVHEEAWNAYPYCKTVLSNPGYMKVNIVIVIKVLFKRDVSGQLLYHNRDVPPRRPGGQGERARARGEEVEEARGWPQIKQPTIGVK